MNPDLISRGHNSHIPDPGATAPDPIECPVCGEAVEITEEGRDWYAWICPGCGMEGGDADPNDEPPERDYDDGPEYADGVMF